MNKPDPDSLETKKKHSMEDTQPIDVPADVLVPVDEVDDQKREFIGEVEDLLRKNRLGGEEQWGLDETEF